ncbi:hypothetical protein AVEN_239088-1 [Araneus ventricosus]|uniref:Uncharacterized protein n=1 Tax=Araneus ventricosus TaxID=182803 RepID=A0A4Y2FQZ8_ARAVE|nr:hypothetical protein AVEN_239088-1 [Araneus ventricosus]
MDRPRAFEPWSDNKDGISACNPISNFRLLEAGEGIFVCTRPTYATDLWWNMEPSGPEAETLSPRTLKSSQLHFDYTVLIEKVVHKIWLFF